MSDAIWWDGEELEIRRFPYLDPASAAEPPTTEHNTGPFRRLCINAEWARFVIGMLTRLLRVDAWAGTQERKEHAIEMVEQMIAMLAQEFGECIPEDTQSEIIQEIVQMGASIVMEGEEMGQVVTEVYIDETGLLVVKYGMCCEKTFDIGGAITDQSEDPVPGSLDPDPIPDDVACRKAYWMGQELTRFMNVMWDEFDGAVIFSWASGVRDAMKAYKLSDWDLLKLYDILQGIFIADSVFPDQWTTIDTQRLTCLYVPHLNGVDYTLTREEYDAIKSATGNVGNIAMEVFIKSAFDALNYSNFQRMAAFAQDITVPAGSCDCPDSVEALPDWTTEGDWYVILDYQGQTPLHTVLGDDNGITVITSRGAELQADTPGSDKVSVRWDPPVDTGTIQRVRIEMLMNDVHGSGNEWVGLGLHGPMGNYRQGDIVYTDGIGVLEDTTLDVFPVEFFVTAELNAQTAENPIAPVFTRIILQGIGDHPLGL